jgi:hypothetical protein
MRTLSWLRPTLLLVLAVRAGAAFGSPSIGAPLQKLSLLENWEARARFRDTIFAAVGDAAAHRPVIVGQSDGAAKVSFRADAQSGALYLVFANQDGREFPVAGAGAFIIKRSLKDGSFLQAKVFVQNDPGCYLRLFPRSDRTVMDIFLFGMPFQTQIVLPVAFDRLLTSPVERIIDLSSSSVDWPLVLSPSQGQADQRLSQVLTVIRARLKSLRDLDDGAMDQSGRLVYIASGTPAPAGRGGFNCSGFAKWVVDGFFAPLTGRNTDIAALKSRDALRGGRWSSRYEEELDPYFGLDWTRGLARAVAQARIGTVHDGAQLDVSDADRLPFIKEAGYPVPALRFLLYFLARKDPGTIYLGSVNAVSAEASQEGTPTLRRHHHIVVLFPFFDEKGAFQVVVMETNRETSLASLDRRYAKEYVHLVRLDSTGEFSPPRIE